MKVGVLALQGDVSEHLAALAPAMRRMGLDGDIVQVRRKGEFPGLDGLLIPGGESTTIIKQTDRFGLRDAIIELADSGKPIMGTCAGAILLAREVTAHKGPVPVKPLGLVDMVVKRNAYGRQVDSFERSLRIKGLDDEFPGIFIRAPGIIGIGQGVEPLASLDNKHVMVRQNNVMALTFHPELADDDRVHGLFLGMLRT